MARDDWKQRSACGNADSDIFFPTPRHGKAPDYTTARTYCAVCPVSNECRDAAKLEPYGYWNSTPEERGFVEQAQQRKAVITLFDEGPE